MHQHLAVGIEHLRLRDEAQITLISIHHGEIPCLGVVEDAHHLLHAVRVVQAGGGQGHQFLHREAVIQFLAEHDVAYVIQWDDTQQVVVRVQHGEDVAPRVRDDAHQIAQVHIGADGGEVMLHHVIHLHQRQDGLILVVRQQLALLGQAHGIDAMRLEDNDGQIGADGNNHQRQEEVVTSRQLGDEKDACQGGVHHAAHHAGHAHQGEVLLGQEGRHVEPIAEMREDKAGDTAQVERGGEDTATTASAVGGAGSKDLEDNDEQQIKEQQVAVAIE